LFQKKWRTKTAQGFAADPLWSSYLLCWTLTPMVFFSFAGNILWTYVLPGLPAFALLIAELTRQECDTPNRSGVDPSIPSRVIPRIARASAGVFGALLLLVWLQVIPISQCQKNLILTYRNTAGKIPGELVYIVDRPSSAEFYSQGAAKLVENPGDAEALLQTPGKHFFAVPTSRITQLPGLFLSRVVRLGEFGGYYLLRKETGP